MSYHVASNEQRKVKGLSAIAAHQWLRLDGLSCTGADEEVDALVAEIDAEKASAEAARRGPQ